MIWILITIIAVVEFIGLVVLGVAVNRLTATNNMCDKTIKSMGLDLDAMQRQVDAQERLLVELLHQRAA